MIPKNLKSFKGHIIYGIVPNQAATDYGYIEVEDSTKKISRVKKFFEKPDANKAKIFIKKNFFWNSGIFLINNKKILLDFKKYHLAIFKICKNITECLGSDLEFYETSEKLMKKLPNISFDKAILEKNDDLSMMKINFIWKDLGTWNSLDSLSTKKNLSLDKNSYIHNNSENTTVISDRKFTIVNDLSNVIVVSNKESLFISSKRKSGKIKEILSNKNFSKMLDYQTIFYKPWGHYEVILRSSNYLLKKITVNPNHRLSLQKHKFRSEHWIVVKGVAMITRGKQKRILKKINQLLFLLEWNIVLKIRERYH
jgi:mannose-1-phosphate guanylyltransferase/mannose-6-phosphate isomerase